jgi:hypothetical protein
MNNRKPQWCTKWGVNYTPFDTKEFMIWLQKNTELDREFNLRYTQITANKKII